MSFADSIRTCLNKYATFSGRARRSEFWWFVLFNVIVSIVASILDNLLGTDYETGGSGIIGTIAALALLLPYLAVLARRLHDTDRSGWWILIGLIPLVGLIVLIVFTVGDSTPGPNKYGESPKGVAPHAPGAPA